VQQLGRGRERNKRRVVVLNRAHAVNAANAARQLVPLQATGLFPRAPSPGNSLTTRPRHMHWPSPTPHAAACTRSSLPICLAASAQRPARPRCPRRTPIGPPNSRLASAADATAHAPAPAPGTHSGATQRPSEAPNPAYLAIPFTYHELAHLRLMADSSSPVIQTDILPPSRYR
jgi:hypothetical protein